MMPISLTAAFMVVQLAMPMPNTDQLQCGLHDHVSASLKANGAREVFVEPVTGTALLHIYVDKDQDWLMTMSTVGNVECVIQTGHDWPKDKGASN